MLFFCMLMLEIGQRGWGGGVGGTRGIGAVIAPSGIERKSFFRFLIEDRYCGQTGCNYSPFPYEKDSSSVKSFKPQTAHFTAKLCT